jgi:uncharacterized protein (TIGR02757 family)
MQAITGQDACGPTLNLDRPTLSINRLEYADMPFRKHIGELEDLYKKFNRRELAGHDPIVFLYGYGDPDDREVVAMVASSLAYGRVAQILASVRKVLDRISPGPARFLRDQSDSRLLALLGDFKHRFTTGEDLAALLAAVRDTRRQYGSLRNCFLAGRRDGGESFLPALTHLAETLRSACRGGGKFLLPSPLGGSACKRLNLMLRWLIRRDEVDPGGWEGIEPRGLLVPLDTHMHRMCRAMGATRRRSADLTTTLEVTAAFRTVCPQDPVRFDFAMTRRGILGTAGTIPAFQQENGKMGTVPADNGDRPREQGDCPRFPAGKRGLSPMSPRKDERVRPTGPHSR